MLAVPRYTIHEAGEDHPGRLDWLLQIGDGYTASIRQEWDLAI